MPRHAVGSDRIRPGPSRRSLIAAAAAAAGMPMLPRAARAAVTQLRLAHGLPQAHPVHRAMTNFADIVEQRTNGEVMITLFADGVLGEEPALLEQVRTGTLDLTKASASVLGAVSPPFQVFDMPFLFRDREHWRRVLASPIGEQILSFSTEGASDAPMRGLCFYDAGARSFYGRRPISYPEDLAGLRIRVQPSYTTVRMIQLLNAQPVPLPWRNVYTAFQNSLIDAAENNITALIYGRHAEVVRHYAMTEQTMVPDVLLISARAWNALSRPHREILETAAQESSLLQTELWSLAEGESRRQAEALGVTFADADKAAFARKLSPLRDEFMVRKDIAAIIEACEAA